MENHIEKDERAKNSNRWTVRNWSTWEQVAYIEETGSWFKGERSTVWYVREIVDGDLAEPKHFGTFEEATAYAKQI